MTGEKVGGILCVGLTPSLQRTIRFKDLQIGQVNRAASVVISSGGKPINAARALAALGGFPLVTGFAGGDTGSAMVTLLRDLGLETDMVWTSQATRICTTLIDEATASVTELVEEAPLPTPAEWSALDEKISFLLFKCDMMILAGAPPPGSPVDIYARLAQVAREAGLEVLIDARGEALIQALPCAPFLAKMNDEELAATCGGFLDTEEGLRSAGRELIAGGARWLLVTRGKMDAWLMNETEAWRYTPPAVDVLNAVGSGDATMAGIAAGLRRGQPIPEAVRLGIACGSAGATTLTPGDLDAGLVEVLATEVRVSRIPQ